MEWIKAKLLTASEGLEPVFALLADAGIYGTQIEDAQEMWLFFQKAAKHPGGGQNAAPPWAWDYVDERLLNMPDEETCVVFYVSANAAGRETLLSVHTALARLRTLDTGLDLGRLILQTETVDDESWLHEWKKHYKPFSVGNVIIKPVWETYQAQSSREIVFNINPGHVFGTGLHQTTQLCIKALEHVVTPETKLLDIGCGSGILSIIALLLSAERACAIDIDPNAADIAYENAALNGIAKDRYDVRTGNVLTDGALRDAIAQTAYNVVVANIVADVIIDIAAFVPAWLAPGGVFIASGIIGARVDDVRAALLENNFAIDHVAEQDDWFCITVIKK